MEHVLENGSTIEIDLDAPDKISGLDCNDYIMDDTQTLDSSENSHRVGWFAFEEFGHANLDNYIIVNGMIMAPLVLEDLKERRE